MHNFYTLKWEGDAVSFIDQRLLPQEEVYVKCTDYKQVAEVIETMVVRGAPAIGVAAAYGIALGLQSLKLYELERVRRDFKEICDIMRRTRPTAVNLFWAIDKMESKFEALASSTNDVEKIVKGMVDAANEIYKEDIEINKAIGLKGRDVIKNGMNVLTHCNAGSLATAGYGTALGVIRAAVEQGKKIHVYADETRPFLQGARLTMWELMKDKIDCTLISDNMSGSLMALSLIHI